MDINGKNLCPSCFSEMTEIDCSICGYSIEEVNKYPIALPIGTILMSRYLIGRVLGKGGFGITYLSYDLNENKRVAIKEYLPDNLTHRNTGKTEVSTYADEKGEAFKLGAEKFFEEAKTVSKFNDHPNIINVYEFFYENNTAYFVMEYLNGIDLKNYIIKNGGKLTEERTKEIMMPIIEALTAIHSLGILHRDISPDNIYICEDGSVKLLDFGAARQVLGEQSKSLSVVLKQGFAPIEQYQTRGKQGEWTDIYALGATMFYCLTGSVPESAMDRVYEDNLKSFKELDINISDKLNSIILKAIAVRQTDRYQDTLELMDEFKENLVTKEVIENDEATNNLLEGNSKTTGKRKLLITKRHGIYAAIACVVLIIGISTPVILNQVKKSNVQGTVSGSSITADANKTKPQQNTAAEKPVSTEAVVPADTTVKPANTTTSTEKPTTTAKSTESGKSTPAQTPTSAAPAAAPAPAPAEIKPKSENEYGYLSVDINNISKVYLPDGVNLGGTSFLDVCFMSQEANDKSDFFELEFPANAKTGDVYLTEESNFNDFDFSFVNVLTSSGGYSESVKVTITKWEGKGGYAYCTFSGEIKPQSGEAISFKNGKIKVKID